MKMTNIIYQSLKSYTKCGFVFPTNHWNFSEVDKSFWYSRLLDDLMHESAVQ